MAWKAIADCLQVLLPKHSPMDEDTFYYFQLQIIELKFSEKVLGAEKTSNVMKVNEFNIFNLVPYFNSKTLHMPAKLQKKT